MSSRVLLTHHSRAVHVAGELLDRLNEMGDYETARVNGVAVVETFRGLVEEQPDNDGDLTMGYSRVLNQLFITYDKLKMYGDALRVDEEIAALMMRIHGSSSENTLVSLGNLIDSLLRNHFYDRACDKIDEYLRLPVYGVEGVRVRFTADDLAFLRAQTRSFVKCVACGRQRPPSGERRRYQFFEGIVVTYMLYCDGCEQASKGLVLRRGMSKVRLAHA